MICELHIENIAVIKMLTVEFGNGFSVMTGETGAGKSIIIDSVNFLLGSRSGNRGAKELIRNGEDHALVSACFREMPPKALEALARSEVYPDEEGGIYLQRTVNQDGKTFSRINGRSVPAQVLREIGGLLINIHGQHDNQLLLNPEKHIGFLDGYAHCETELENYRVAFEELVAIRRELKNNTHSEEERNARMETLKYQISEIDSAHLHAGEEEALLAKRDRIRNLEKTSRYAGQVCSSLTAGNGTVLSAYELIERASDAVDKLGELLPDGGEIIKRLNFCSCEIKDISETVSALTDSECEDPETELDRLEGRLELIARLEGRYAPDIAGILEFRKKATEELEGFKNSDADLDALRKKMKAKAKEANELADILNAKRSEGAKRLSEEVTAQLRFLDLDKVVFSVSVDPLLAENGVRRFSPNGCDEVEFMISTNPGEPLKSLSKVASGGELSRVMLALKNVLADSDGVQTIIFDEIDTGVSGKTSEKIGIKLRALGKTCQVICITHSAQIAANGDAQYKIIKEIRNDRAETSIKELKREERITEIARIMGGIEITDTVRATASEMLFRASGQK